MNKNYAIFNYYASNLFCEKYNVTYSLTNMRFVEKIHEELINETQSLFSYKKNKFIHIKSAFENMVNNEPYILSSDKRVISKNNLKILLQSYL